MASSVVLMRRRRSQRPRQPNCEERLAAQVAELEQRIKLLEARVRSAVAEGALGGRAGAALKAPRGENCVWCGFSFAAVPARP